MDPLSITTACLALLGTVAKTSLAVTTFIRGCRDARSDLTSLSGELTQLHLVLDLLKDDASVTDGRVIPESLQAQILSIIKNCSAVIDNINKVLQNHSGKTGAAKWVAFGKAEVAGLRMSLEAHRGSLNLVLELVSVSMSRAILDGVTVVRGDMIMVRDDVHDIKQDTSQIPQIMAELTRLRAILAAGNIPTTMRDQNYVLERYLDSLTSYAETVCNDVVWDSDGGSRHTLSRKPSAESVGGLVEESGAREDGEGGIAELIVGRSDDKHHHGPSQPSATAAARPGSPQLAALSASDQAPGQACEPVNPPSVAEPDLALPGHVVLVPSEAARENRPPDQVANLNSQIAQPIPVHTETLSPVIVADTAPSKVADDFAQAYLTTMHTAYKAFTTQDTRPNHEVSPALDDKNPSAVDATAVGNPDNTGVMGPSRRDYDPYNYTMALARHAPPAAPPPSRVVILPHEDIPPSPGLTQLATSLGLSGGPVQPSAITAKLPSRPQPEDTSLLSVPPVDDPTPQVPATESILPVSSGAEARRKLCIVGDGATGKSTLFM